MSHQERGGDVALDEAQASFIVQLAHVIAIGLKGADEGGEGHDATVGEELAHLTHTTDVLRAICAQG
jgi:hypothetical protein